MPGRQGERQSRLLLMVAVCLVAANMRPAVSAIGPLLDQIGDDTGMGTRTLGLITSVPLLVWGIFSTVAHDLARRFGISRVMLWSLLLLSLGTAVRSLPGSVANLWIGTVLLGFALAIVNVLLPSVIKRDFPGNVSGVTALCTAILSGFGAFASGLAVPVSQLPWPQDPAGWRLSLLVTGAITLPLALGAWLWSMTRPRTVRNSPAGAYERTGIWTNRLAWLIAAYMACQSSVFYMLITWLAAISTSTGRSHIVAGVDVMFYQLLSIIGALVLPLLLRGAAGHMVPALIPSFGVLGAVGLLLFPHSILFWGACMGLSAGASLTMSFTLMAQRTHDPGTAATLSGMAQSVAYIVAAAGPVLFGWLHAWTNTWTCSLVLLLGIMAGQAATGILLGRDRRLLE